MAVATTLPLHDPTRKSDRELAIQLPARTTLLELVQAISGCISDDKRVVEIVLRLIERGQVRLEGNFRDAPITDFDIRPEPPERS